MMRTTKLALVILGALTLAVCAWAQSPEDSILKQLDRQLKADAIAASRDVLPTQAGGQRHPETGATRIPGMVDEKPENLYGAGRVFLGSYASFRLIDIAETSHITGAGGVAIVGGYHLVDNVALVAEGQTENTGHSVFDVASAGVQFFIPVSQSGLAFYGKLLAGREFEGEEDWLGAAEVGVEVRGKHFGAFGGLRYTYNWEDRSDLTPCIGLNYHFGTH